MFRRCLNITAALLLCLAVAACQTAPQTTGPATAGRAQVQPVSAVPVAYAPAETGVHRGFSALVIDGATGAELYAVDADEPRFPASLTKMMTLYLLFEEVANGRFGLTTPLEVSGNAAAQPPSKIGVQAGSTITVEQAARALAVRSANDVAVVVAENIAGSEAAFARRMSDKARQLGLSRTRFVNSSGLTDPAQVTTARDMAKLGQALTRRFPQYAGYYRAQSFTYNGRNFRATNNLLGKVPGVDGLKTGYLRMSGYNLVATSRRGQKRLVVVVIGGASEQARDAEVARLIDAFS
ncbi:hypothetical protein GCM10011316_05300 [Roseibium aquae]|uniref:Peptidase S11 D-alanyl-D-alanine carboxypeptidase A N-terminal domain-containing protein n=1 Tax=Roseibium aquae TaxID=1323746 RepID=A0A916TA48_9HYPH|nr:D-alanyl-D-alanine carboxypeptidase family protein [Roseibium aquae]GGB36092.1 hypothetical protein GCM10011316_05300 [Roseibium aquae]